VLYKAAPFVENAFSGARDRLRIDHIGGNDQSLTASLFHLTPSALKTHSSTSQESDGPTATRKGDGRRAANACGRASNDDRWTARCA